MALTVLSFPCILFLVNLLSWGFLRKLSAKIGLTSYLLLKSSAFRGSILEPPGMSSYLEWEKVRQNFRASRMGIIENSDDHIDNG
jgi:hypothetical protein